MTIHDRDVEFAGLNLALRPGEGRHYRPIQFDQRFQYAVMLHPVPSFPGIAHEEAYSYTVLCACTMTTENERGGTEVRWIWVQMDAKTKTVIGEDLLQIDAKPGEWYYMVLTEGYGHRDMDYMRKHHMDAVGE